MMLFFSSIRHRWTEFEVEKTVTPRLATEHTVNPLHETQAMLTIIRAVLSSTVDGNSLKELLHQLPG